MLHIVDFVKHVEYLLQRYWKMQHRTILAM